MDRLGVPVKGKIPPDEALLPGRALARLSDLGWGQRLREVLRDGRAGARPSCVRACVPGARRVGLGPAPGRRRRRAVALAPARWCGSLAAGLAEIGRLPFLGSLDLAHGGPTGEPGGNSAFRLAGVWERLVVGPDLAAAAGAASTARCSSSTTSCRRGGPSPSPGGPYAWPGAPGVLPFALAVDG